MQQPKNDEIITDSATDEPTSSGRPAIAIGALKTKLQQIKPLLVIVGIGLLIFGSFGIVNWLEATKGKAKLPDSGTTATEITSEPDERKPSPEQESSYSVPADQPRSIRIVSINVSGLIQRVGTTKNQEVDVPSNIHYAGWYTPSALPGQRGLSIIDGHVSGKYSPGIFENLQTIKMRDAIDIEFGNRTKKKFYVVDIIKSPEQESADILFKKRPEINSQLNLITCSGKFNASTNTYDGRVIVVAKLAE